MVMAHATSRKAPQPLLSRSQSLSHRVRSSNNKDLNKIQQLLTIMNLKDSDSSNHGGGTKGASGSSAAVMPEFQAPQNTTKTRTSSRLLKLKASLRSYSQTVRALSPAQTNSTTAMLTDDESPPNNIETPFEVNVVDPIPPPPWLSAPPITQYSVDSIISDMGSFSIDQSPAAPEEATPAATSHGTAQTWLPSAPASEESVDGGYDMRSLQDALGDCGRVPETNHYVDFGYHTAVLDPPYPPYTVDSSYWASALSQMETRKVKRMKKYKTSGVPYTHERELRKKRRYSSDSDRSDGCPSNIPAAVALLPYVSQRRVRETRSPLYDQLPINDPHFPYGSDTW